MALPACPPVVARTVAGLPAAIDAAADAAPPERRFLRRHWYAAALEAYGGAARTVVVARGDRTVAALPLVALGPKVLGLAQVPGSYWPFRSMPLAQEAAAGDVDALLAAAGRAVRGFRLGPVHDDDPAVVALLAAAARAGWRAIPRHVAESYVLDMAALRAGGPWPRASTAKSIRYQEKQLAAEGALDWTFVTGAAWTPDIFEALADIERASWISARTDGRDAKFTATGHGAFWRAAARDPAIAATIRAAILRVDGTAAAFSFDLDAGTMKYVVANSYDPRFARHSPGKLLYYRNLAEALARGIDRVDWGAGDSGYKRVTGAEPGPAIRDWLFLRPGLPAWAGRWIAPRWRASGHAPVAAAD
ncbi:GNAT family N-acetyltransferase [Sphingomonas sp. VNH70]|uniref:GNAT family N-acetyltransferase n=1 Tax=Sphingomonas silueang TaxID=3156617 RepID=UPI0032B37DC0